MSDDEFEDLFSFSSPTKPTTVAGAGTTAGAAAATATEAPSSSASGDDDFLDFDLDNDDDAAAPSNTLGARAVAAEGDNDDDAFLDMFGDDSPTTANATSSAKAGTATRSVEDEFDDLLSGLTSSRALAPAPSIAELTKETSATTGTSAPTSDPAAMFDLAGDDDDNGNVGASGTIAGTTATAGAIGSAPATATVQVPAPVAAVEAAPPPVPASNPSSMPTPAPATSGGTTATPAAIAASPESSVAVAAAPACGTSPPAADTVLAAPEAKVPVPAPARPPAPLSAPALVHSDDDFHVHDAETREMLDFLGDDDDESNKDRSGDAAAEANNVSGTATPSVAATIGTAEQEEDHNDDDFGAFATAESVQEPSPSGLSSSKSNGMLGGGVNVADRIGSEDNVDGNGFDFEKDILGVVPTEEEEMTKNAEKEEEERKNIAPAAAAVEGTLTTDSPETTMNKSKPSLLATKSNGTTSIPSIRNLSISSKPGGDLLKGLSNPLRRKTESHGEKGGASSDDKSERAAATSTCMSSSTTTTEEASTSSILVESTASTTATTQKVKGGMGSFLSSMKPRKMASVGGSGSLASPATLSDATCNTAKNTKQETKGKVSVAGGADSTGATDSSKTQVIVLPPKPIPPPVFNSISEAIRSPLSTTTQVCAMVEEERKKTVSGLNWVIAKEDRPFLWCKLLSGKTLDDLKVSSLADGFAAWDRTFTIGALEGWLDNTGDNPRNDEGSIPDLGGLDSTLVGKVLTEGRVLAKRTVEGTSPDSDPSALKKAERDLCSIVLFHYRNAAVAASVAASARHPAGRRSFGSSSEQDESMERNATNGSANADAIAKNRAGDGKNDTSTEKSVLLSSKGPVVTNEKSTDDSQKASEDEDSSSEDSLKRAARDQDQDAMAIKIEHDALLAPVVSTLLSASIPPPVASVVLTRLFATALPLMALSDAPPPIEGECEDDDDEVNKGEPYPERTVAARSMHASLYLLACYHLPVLVTHLDRYCPGWHWPRKVGPMEGGVSSHDTGEETKEGHPTLERGEATDIGRNPQNHGFIPMSWFVSHLAGQTGSSYLEIPQLLCLWDTLLTGTDLSIKFFLALAVLDSHTDTLLMLSGAELGSELNNIMSFGDRTARVIEDDFIGGKSAAVASSAGDDGAPRSALEKVEDWLEQARVLEKSTPKSVLADLRAAEDAAVAAALERRRAIAEQRLKAKLEAEKQAHRNVQAELRKQRNDEAKRALIRARLTQYYRRNAPEKIANVDKIMIAYAGRYDVLDKQLKEKYGHGFLPHLPTINPQLSSTTNKLLSSMGTGLKDKKAKIAERVETVRKNRREGARKEGNSTDFGVAVRVKSEEVLPILCAGHTSSKDVEDDSNATAPPPSGLKFYLVDSRPDDTASEQGRFPTSVGLSPEALMDPERIHGQVELFESLRSAVHIVVMGEGFSHFPSLFEHRLTPREQALAEEDDARTSLCALFFIKRGYPFVSILDGGFAAAHSWLARNAPSTERCAKLLSPSTVLVDYDRERSTFAQLEAAYQEQKALASASTTERTSKALQKIIDSSMTGLTVSEGRIEELYAELASVESRQKARKAVSKQTAKVGNMISGLRSINVGGSGFAGGSNRSGGGAGGGSIASSNDDVSFAPVAIAEAESQDKAMPTALSSFGNPFSKNTADEKKKEVDDLKSSVASRKQSMKLPQQPDRFKKINFPSFASASKAAPKNLASTEEKQPSRAEDGATSAAPPDPTLAVEIKPTETGKFSFLVSPRRPASKPTNDLGAALTTATETEHADVDAERAGVSVPAKHSFSFLASSKKQIVDSAVPSTGASSSNAKKAGAAASRFGDAFSQARESLKDPLTTQVKNPFAKLGAKNDADLINEAEEALDEDTESPSTLPVRNLKMSLGSMSLPGKGFSFATAKASLSSDASRQNTQETGQSLGSKLKLKVGGLGASMAIPDSAEEHEETEEESISFHSEDDGINED